VGNQKINTVTILMYSLLFICNFTSHDWSYKISSTEGEIFRFDKILLFGQVNIYHLFGILFLIYILVKFVLNNGNDIFAHRNYLKNIFWMYFIPVNILIYLTVYIKDIDLIDLGLNPIVTFFAFLIFIYYIQDIFLKDKDKKQVFNILTFLEVLIFSRCCYSIVKYLLGFGEINPIIGGVRLGEEEDFTDFFILLLIIALVRLLFGKDEDNKTRILHMLGLITSFCIVVFSFRRFFWIEAFIAVGIILFFHYRFNKVNFNIKVATVCFSLVIIIGSILFVGVDRIANNYYTGRLITIFSLIDYKFESKYGTDTGHRKQIEVGWYNVKKNWFLGITPFGKDKMERTPREVGLYVHNGYFLVWLNYGLLGLILFMFLYFKSIQLGYIMFFKFNNNIGLILLIFMICQMIKNIVWQTAIIEMNITVIYIFLISLVLKAKQLEVNGKINSDKHNNPFMPSS